MDNLRLCARETDTPGGPTKFWQTSLILLSNPHTINRRVAVSSELLLCELQRPLDEVLRLLRSTDFPPAETEDDRTRLADLLNVRSKNETLSIASLPSEGTYLRIAKLLPRDKSKFSTTLEVAVIDRSHDTLTYHHVPLETGKRSLGTDFVWRLKWEEDGLSLEAEEGASWCWIAEQLFPKFVKWMTNEAPGSFVSGSLKLVDSEKYSLKYDELKKKYGTEMVRIWPENTDPLKFVYEDVAIATYLLLLWEDERKAKGEERLQSFVDLGCGNGLLVHILASEGHPGLGIDLRPRKIWDLFPSSTKLEVRTIIPSSASLFPETDWLIGNHSDELTPWIPVISARSSYKCRFFLLPCCAYEFDGSKYRRADSSLSQYQEYMTYVQSIGESCGFKTLVDKLRIPSTKRVCFVGSDRTYPEEEHISRDCQIQQVIHQRSPGNATETWSSDFKPRETVERVRNCTKVDKDLVADIIRGIVEGLLSQRHLVDAADGRKWNAGGAMEIKQAVELLEVDQLKRLKNECGGLQTLLRNNGHIFRVAEGKVRLKTSLGSEKSSGRGKRRRLEAVRKVKPCWFRQNHPDGCPLADDQCNFRHD